MKLTVVSMLGFTVGETGCGSRGLQIETTGGTTSSAASTTGGAGGSAGIVAGTTSYVGLTGAAGGSTRTIGGAGGGDAAPNCTNERPDAGANSCSFTFPVPCKPCIACAPLLPGDASGCGAPDFPFGDWPGGGVDTSLRYPEGCNVVLPTGSYYDSPQTCYCDAAFGTPFPGWWCGL